MLEVRRVMVVAGMSASGSVRLAVDGHLVGHISTSPLTINSFPDFLHNKPRPDSPGFSLPRSRTRREYPVAIGTGRAPLRGDDGAATRTRRQGLRRPKRQEDGDRRSLWNAEDVVVCQRTAVWKAVKQWN